MFNGDGDIAFGALKRDVKIIWCKKRDGDIGNVIS